MEEKLISFETAKLAKEKGFNGKCRAKIHCSHYHLVIDNIIPKNVPTSENEMFAPLNDWNNHEEHDHYRKQTILKGLNTSLPTQSLLQKWLREVHNIHIVIHYDYSIIGSYIVTDIIKSIEPRFINQVNKKSKYENYKNYEESLEIGLQESLKLIKNE